MNTEQRHNRTLKRLSAVDGSCRPDQASKHGGLTPEQRRLFVETFGSLDIEDMLRRVTHWQMDEDCEAACPYACHVEPDGICEHGQPSWLAVLGFM